MKLLLKIICLLLLTSLSSVSFALKWEDLWLRPDQQGIKALKQGKPNDAAQLFTDTQWKGVANYRAGEYQKAAEAFGTEDTATGYYNQGNSEAYMGDYQAAINSYEQSLKINPNDPDAKQNLEIVKKLLQQQQSSDSSENKPSDQQQNQQSNNNQQQQNNSQQNQQQQRQSQNSNSQNEDAQQSKEQSSTQQAQQQNSQNQKQEQDPPPDQQSQSQQQFAQQDEQKQSMQQWLQRIPDDPGGLLKQKFLRDHQRYEAKKNNDAVRWQ